MTPDKGRREAVQYDQFKSFADEFLAEHGREPSIRAAVAALGGSNTTISHHKRAWLTHKERLGGHPNLSTTLPETMAGVVSQAVTQVLESVWTSMLVEQQQRQDDQSEQLVQQHEVYLQEIELIQQQLARQEHINQDLTKDHAALATQHDELQERLEAVTLERNQARESLAAATAKADVQIQELEKECDDLIERLDDKRTQLKELHTTNEQQKTQLATTQEKVAAEQKKQAATVTNYLKQLADLESRLTEDIDQAKNDQRKLQNTLDQEQSEHQRTKDGLLAKTQELEHLAHANQSMASDLGRTQARIAKLDQRLRTLAEQSTQPTKAMNEQLAAMEKRLIKQLKQRGTT